MMVNIGAKNKHKTMLNDGFHKDEAPIKGVIAETDCTVLKVTRCRHDLPSIFGNKVKFGIRWMIYDMLQYWLKVVLVT